MNNKLQVALLAALLAMLGSALWEIPGRSQGSPATAIQQTSTMLNAATKVATTGTPTVNVVETATMTPSGSNYVYITEIDLSACQDGTGGTAVTNLAWTSTGITGAPQWQVSIVSTANICMPARTITFATPLKSSTPGVAATIVSPAQNTHVAYVQNVTWYEAP